MSWLRSDIAVGCRANNHTDAVRTKSTCHVLRGETNSPGILLTLSSSHFDAKWTLANLLGWGMADAAD